MSYEPHVSIVLPTYNRRERLARVLDGLDKQSVEGGRFEAVIVDDGSTDGTAEWMEANRTRPYALRYLRQKNGGPARARNAGIAEARAPLLLFLDDDVEPTPELVAEHLASHAAEAGVVVMGPLGSLESYAQPWVAWEQEKLEAQYNAMLRGDWEPTFRQFWTGNASVAKQAVLDAGGFDPTFPRAEDVELARRLDARGLKFRFNPRARGLHHAERSLAAWVAMHKSYGSLEVRIFRELGESHLVEILADNWSHVHPLSRWLVKRCLGRDLPREVASRALSGYLRLAEAATVPLLTNQVCGALANLSYWSASVTTMGNELAERVFTRGDELLR